MYLNIHSYYSLRYGTISIEKLVSTAKQYGINAMALTDINNTTGIPDFVMACNKAGIKPIAGMEFRNGDELLFIAIAKNNEGFKEINDLYSNAVLKGNKLPDKPPFLPNVNIIFPFKKGLSINLKDNEWIGIKPSQAGLLWLTDKRKTNKMVIMHSVTYNNQTEYYLHKNLRAIDHNILLSKVDSNMIAGDDEIFIEPVEILKNFENFHQIISNTLKILNESNIDFEFGKNKNKATFTGSIYNDQKLLEKLTYEGLKYRYGKNNLKAEKRIKSELQIINNLGFSAYFLITHDIIKYSMSQGIHHVGRGSGANSVVAYCLKITDVDPIELNLYFERFLNPKRTSPPDFDIDYSWKEREKIQQYIFKKFGNDKVAMLGTTVTFKRKSTYRELGKVHGLPKSEIDTLTENPASQINKNSINKHIHLLANMMTGFPGQRSIHAGGILISEKPLTYYTAFDLPPKGFRTVQWDMYVAERLGYEKLDILSQRGIGHIKDAVEIIKKNRNIEIDIHKVNKLKTDKKIKVRLRKGETNGCFYIESPAMRSLLKKLQCDDYLTLVAASSIIRPGVARSGMMKEYIFRHHNPDKLKYIHPIMREQLSETYGVMVYQEDVLKVCHHFAGLDLADADVLRRAMSGKYRSHKEFRKITDKFFTNCKKKKYPEKIYKEVWRQIESFAGYSFSKAHSASYAVESFQSLYLKTYYPLEFQVAVINNFGGFFDTWVYFNELVQQGGKLHLPCVNRSEHLTSITGKDIYMGFIHIKKLEQNTAFKIINNRNKNGKYTNLENFIKRVSPEKEQLILLIKSGALRFTGKTKPELLWEAHLLLQTKRENYNTLELFNIDKKEVSLPTLKYTALHNAYDEIEIFGFPVSTNAFDMLKTSYRGQINAGNLDKHIGKTVKMVGRLVTVKYIKTIKKEIMNFGTFIDYKGDFFDTVHFPDNLKKYPFEGSGIYLILGKIVQEFGYSSLEVKKFKRLEYKTI